MPTIKSKTAKAKKAVKRAVKKVVKKATKKSPKKATKKVVKKTTRKKKEGKPLVYSSDGESFWVSDGQILNNLIALRDALDAMDKEVYKLHAGGKSNDFAKWVEKVLCDKKCATDLRKAKTQRGARTVVVRHLKFYSL